MQDAAVPEVQPMWQVITDAIEVQQKLENGWFIELLWEHHAVICGPGDDRAEVPHEIILTAMKATMAAGKTW